LRLLCIHSLLAAKLKLKLVWDAFGAEFYGFELDVVGVAFEGDLANEGGEQYFVLAFVGPVG
jgi:hypothetical protein